MAKKITVNGSTSYPFEETQTRAYLTKDMHTASISDYNADLFIGDGWDVVPNPAEMQLQLLGDCPTNAPKVVYSDIWAEMLTQFEAAETAEDIIDVCTYYSQWHKEHGNADFAATLEAVALDKAAAAKFRSAFIRRYSA